MVNVLYKVNIYKRPMDCKLGFENFIWTFAR